jgi:hypothetical protein
MTNSAADMGGVVLAFKPTIVIHEQCWSILALERESLLCCSIPLVFAHSCHWISGVTHEAPTFDLICGAEIFINSQGHLKSARAAKPPLSCCSSVNLVATAQYRCISHGTMLDVQDFITSR